MVANDERRKQAITLLRQLLDVAFTADDLTAFCLDHFPDVYDEVARSANKLDKIGTLVTHCARHRQIETLIAAIKQVQPRYYFQFSTRLAKSPPFPYELFQSEEQSEVADQHLVQLVLMLTTSNGHRPKPDTQVYAWLRVDDKDFDILDKDVQPITWTSGGPEPLTFQLQAKHTGRSFVRIELYHESTYLGVVNEPVPVAFEGKRANAVCIEKSVTLEPDLPPPDLLIRFYKADVRDGETIYEYRVSSPLPELKLMLAPMGAVVLNDPAVLLRPLLEDLDHWARLESVNQRDLSTRLQAIGMHLYEELVPAALDCLYWRLPCGCHSVQIIADVPEIPWEMLCPKGVGGKKNEPLATQFCLTRWRPEVSTSLTNLQLNQMKLFVGQPITPLPGAETEATTIEALMQSLASRVPPEELTQTLESATFDILHIISHGYMQSEDADESYIEVGGGKPQLRASDLARYDWSARRPLLFINACHSGRMGVGLTGLGGWATTALIQAHAGAFIGALWQATDGTAGLFAQAFYAALLTGVTVGEAAQQARKAIANRPDPTWLCYAVYAHPNMRIKQAH